MSFPTIVEHVKHLNSTLWIGMDEKRTNTSESLTSCFIENPKIWETSGIYVWREVVSLIVFFKKDYIDTFLGSFAEILDHLFVRVHVDGCFHEISKSLKWWIKIITPHHEKPPKRQLHSLCSYFAVFFWFSIFFYFPWLYWHGIITLLKRCNWDFSQWFSFLW